jgi:PD-(D/E)XK endonuclease
VNTKAIGERTEAIILAEFLKVGFPVLLPFGDNQRYDLVVEVNGVFKRVQCKTARVIQSGSVLCFNARSTNPRRDGGSYRSQADLFAVYSNHTKQVYVLAVDEVGEVGVWLRLTPAKNCQQLGVRKADDYLLETWAARVSQLLDQ